MPRRNLRTSPGSGPRRRSRCGSTSRLARYSKSASSRPGIPARSHGEQRLSAVQRLDLGLLVKRRRLSGREWARMVRLLKLFLVAACVLCVAGCFESYDGEGLVNHSLSVKELEARPPASLVYPNATVARNGEDPGALLPHVPADRQRVLVSSDPPEVVTRWYEARIKSMGFAACSSNGPPSPDALGYCGRRGSECSRQRFNVRAQTEAAARLSPDPWVSSAVRDHPGGASYVLVIYFVYGPGYPCS